MPYPLRTPDGPGPSPDRYPPHTQPDNKEKPARSGSKTSNAATAHPPGAQTPQQTSRKATRIKKLEDLNDREDLSERKFSDRNWQ